MPEALAPDLDFDLSTGTLVRDGKHHRLTTKEAEVLRYLVAHEGQTVTREQLETEVWRMAANVKSSTVSVTVRRLRAKLERDTSSPRYLQTLVGIGWRLDLPKTGAPLNRSPYRSSLLPRPSLMEAVHTALEQGTRLLSLVGAAGVGKTRLAWSIVERWTGEVQVLHARSLPPGPSFGARLRHALELATESDLALALEDRGRFLLVLDGVEAHREELGRWVEEEPLDVTLLLTSREALGLPGEWVLEVPPLRPDEVEALIGLRTGQGVEAFRPLVPHLRTPLEVELCVASGIPPASIVGDLEAGQVPDTLEPVLQRGWQRLDEPERRLLLVAATFQGALHQKVAEEVLGEPVEPTLRRLQRRHWLRGGELLPFVRSFLRGRPQAEGVEAVVAAALAAHASSLLARHDRDFLEVLAHARALEADLEHLARTGSPEQRVPAALLVVTVLGWCWSESRLAGLLEAVLRGAWEHPLRVLLETLRANVVRRVAGPTRAHALARRLPRPAPGDPHEGEWLALHAYLEPLDEERLAWIEAVLQTRPPEIRAWVLRGIWLQHRELHDDLDLGEVYDLELDLAPDGLSRRMLTYTKLFLGLNLGEAEALLEESQALGLQTLALNLQHRLAMHEVRFQPDRARQRFEKLRSARRRRGDRAGLRVCLGTEGVLAYGASELAVALPLLEELQRSLERGSAPAIHIEGYLWAVRTGLDQVSTPYDGGWLQPEVAHGLVRGPDADVRPLVQLLRAERSAAVLRRTPGDAGARAALHAAADVAASLPRHDIEVACLCRRVETLVERLG